MLRSVSIFRSGLVLALAVAPAASGAGEADVVAVSLECEAASETGSDDVSPQTAPQTGERVCLLRVSVSHNDQGWDHYADGWEVMKPGADEILATRILHHPHVDEQPFERSLAGVRIPAGLERVRVRAHDKLHGHGGLEKTVELPD